MAETNTTLQSNYPLIKKIFLRSSKIKKFENWWARSSLPQRFQVTCARVKMSFSFFKVMMVDFKYFLKVPTW